MSPRNPVYIASLFVILLMPAAAMAEAVPPPAKDEAPPARTFQPGKLPQLRDGSPRRLIEKEGYRIELDLAPQILALHIPKPQDWRTSATEIQPGDTVEVTAPTARIMSGQHVLASVPRGSRLQIQEVKEQWLATAVVVGGKRQSGWVHKRDVKFARKELDLYPTLAHALDGGFASAAVLVNKAKQFDDGLYAAVELAAQNGAGKFTGKKKLLETLAAALLAQSENGGSPTLLAGARIGGVALMLPPAAERDVRAVLDAFFADPLRSKPLAFYTWNSQLTAIFQQDRMLQTELTPGEIAALAKALHGRSEARQAYETYVHLTYQLTNPTRHYDLRPHLAALDGQNANPPQSAVHFFPPSISHETTLVTRLYGDSRIPEGFSLMKELMNRIRKGDIDLKPTDESGWYDYQTYSLEPLVIPQKTAEAEHLQLSSEYQQHLDELFQGVLALTRETHIKQLEVPAAGAAAPFEEPRPKVFIAPDLDAEPLATMYARRAESYRFVRGVLENTFGPEALQTMRRQTVKGGVKESLADELDEMESLFHGAAVAVRRQLGLPEKEANPADEAAARRFLAWGAAAAGDPDVGQDNRMMVPVFFDRERGLTKVWAVLGWVRKDLYVSFARQPKASVTDKNGNAVGANEGPELHFTSDRKTILAPVFAEVYVRQLMDRDEFRRHCDTYKTQDAILSNLP